MNRVESTRKAARMPFVVTIVALLFSVSAWGVEAPKNYPERPIEVVVQYGAGGGSDIFVRSLMLPARKYLKVAINVTNMPGGAGVKASSYVLSQPADGYIIYNFSPEQLINTVFGRENYSEEFAPLCQVQQDISMFYVGENSKFKNIQEVIQYAKDHPDTLQFTGSNPASPDEILIMRFARHAGIKIKYIPFDKAPESHAAVLGGHLDVLHEEPGVILSLIEAKKLRPILVFADERLARFPDVPTAKEIGIDITTGRWRGLAVKKGTPQSIIDYLADVLKKSSEAGSYKAIAKASLLDIRPGWKGPKEFGTFWNEEFKSYKEILDDLGYTKKK